MSVEAAEDPAHAGSIGAVMLGGGYCVAAAAPLVLGAVRQASGQFSSALWLLPALALALVAWGRVLPQILPPLK